MKKLRTILISAAMLLLPALLLVGCNQLPEVPKTEGSKVISSTEMMKLIREGTIVENGDYTVTDGKGLAFDKNDNLKKYDLHGATVRISTRSGESAFTVDANGMTLKNGSIAIYGGTGVYVRSGKDVSLTNLHFSGEAESAVWLSGSGAAVAECTFASEKLACGILAEGTDLAVSGCTFTEIDTAISDRSTNGVVVESNTFESCRVGVAMQSNGTSVWYNTFNGGECAVSAEFEQSELSAAESTGYNLLVAANEVHGAKVVLKNASNTVLLLNTLEQATVEGCTNVYVSENTVSGTLTLKDNRYLVCNGNNAAQLSEEGSEYANGSDVTDLNARTEVGANETLLPQINPEQFAGMEQRELRTAEGAVKLKRYLEKNAESGKTIIVPPGRYSGAQADFSDCEGLKIYAYGVYNEISAAGDYAVNFYRCVNSEIYGMFLGYQTHPHIQGTVVAVENNGGTIKFEADPGYIQDYTSLGTVEGRVLRDGVNFGLIRYLGKEYDKDTQINTLLGCETWCEVAVGDRIAFRNTYPSGGFYFYDCSGMKMEDVTVFNSSAFAESDLDNETAPLLHRYAVTQGPAPILEGKAEDYDSELVYTDRYGRTRSAAPLLTTIDATHSTNARTGIQIVSCLFEGMDDDMTNINGHYGLAEDYDEQLHTLIYGLSNVNGYRLLPAEFRVGDELEMFNMQGKHVSSVTVESVSTKMSGDHYALTLPADFTLTPEELDWIRNGQVVVQNRSATGNGFVIDNVKVHKTVGRVLLKGGPGVVKNSTFSGMGYNVITAHAEVTTWPEVGYLHDVQILNNLFDGNSARATFSEAWLQSGNMTDMNLVGIVNENPVTDSEDCMLQNITISGNIFRNRYANFAITVNAVMNLTITNNTFEAKMGETADSDTAIPILVIGGNGITVSDNTWPANAPTLVDNRNLIPTISGNNAP